MPFPHAGQNLASGAQCDMITPAPDYDKGSLDTLPAYCVIREWLKREGTCLLLAPHHDVG